MIFIALGLIGATVIITQSSLFEVYRNYIGDKSEFFGELVSCPMCMGFWVGLFAGFFYNIDPLLLGFSTSLLSWVLVIFTNLLKSLIYYLDAQYEIEEESD